MSRKGTSCRTNGAYCQVEDRLAYYFFSFLLSHTPLLPPQVFFLKRLATASPKIPPPAPPLPKHFFRSSLRPSFCILVFIFSRCGLCKIHPLRESDRCRRFYLPFSIQMRILPLSTVSPSFLTRTGSFRNILSPIILQHSCFSLVKPTPLFSSSHASTFPPPVCSGCTESFSSDVAFGFFLAPAFCLLSADFEEPTTH